MTPLTLDCTVVQQQLGAYRDGEVPSPEGEQIAAHLERCAACATEFSRLEDALVALKTLTGRDVDRLRAEATPFDPRPLTTLIGFGAVVLIAALIGLVALAFRPGLPPAAPLTVLPPQVPTAIVLPTVGAVVGLEEDLAWVPEARSTEPLAIRLPEPEPVDVVAAPVEAPQPKPVAIQPPAPAPKPVAAAPKKAPATVKPERIPLPEPIAKAMARWRVTNGLGYKGIEFYLIQDPNARDRLGDGSLALPRVQEVNPPRPDAIAIKPPRNSRRYLGLTGELVEAPYGLRILERSGFVEAKPTTAVGVSFNGLTRRATPILRSPVLLPSVARRELLLERDQQALAELLQVLNDPSLLEFRRLREELARVESDARDLERRFRGLLSRERGLRGLAFSVGNQARSMDLFPDGASFGAVFPKLLRTALLEEALHSAQERMAVDDFADSRPRTLTPGVSITRKAQIKLLELSRKVTATPGDDRYTARDGESVAEVRIRREALIHAASLR